MRIAGRLLASLIFLALGTLAPLAQEAPARASDMGRILAAAGRARLPESDLVPVLAGLDRLGSEGLPTERYTGRVVECIAKRAPGSLLQQRADRMVEETRAARLLVENLRTKGLQEESGDHPVAYEWSPVEDLADTLDTGVLTAGDLARVREALHTDSLSRVLAGAEVLAHLRAMKVGDRSALMVLGAVPPSLSDGEIRRLPAAFFVARRCGLPDADVLQKLFRQLGDGAKPSALMRQWAQEAGLRGPGMGPGAGRGMGGPGFGRGTTGGEPGSFGGAGSSAGDGGPGGGSGGGGGNGGGGGGGGGGNGGGGGGGGGGGRGGR